MEEEHVIRKFPWMGFLQPVADRVICTLFDKERDYKGSWQKRGGQGAFMMMARKWDRIENIVSGAKHNYDVFQALEENTADVLDDVDDLVGYLLLVRAEIERRATVVSLHDTETDAMNYYNSNKEG